MRKTVKSIFGIIEFYWYFRKINWHVSGMFGGVFGKLTRFLLFGDFWKKREFI